MSISIMNRKWVSALITVVIFAAVILFTTPTAQAYENLAPSALNLYTADSSESDSSVHELHLEISNASKLYRETQTLISEINDKGYEYTGLSLQVQLKTDDQSWKTYKVGYFGNIESDDTVSDIIIDPNEALDLKTHTIYAKVRYAWTYQGGSYYGSWSDVAAIGKNAASASVPKSLAEAPTFSEAFVDFAGSGEPQFNMTFEDLPDDVSANTTNPKGTLMLNVMISENGNEYRNLRFQQASNIKLGKALQCSMLNDNNTYESGSVKIKARFEWYTGGTTYYGTKKANVVSPWSEEIILTVPSWSKASDWALPELEKADSLELIPSHLMGKDLTKSITRAEFAAMAVKTYEAMSGKTAQSLSVSPFTDCDDPEVLKAYNLGIVNGISETSYAPDENINREQASVMMTRVYKILNFEGWTLPTDPQYKLEYQQPAPFLDDPMISEYAKDSVYFMAANNIINGIGNNLFAPKNTTDTEKRKGYANATRQQALLIAVRMTENLK